MTEARHKHLAPRDRSRPLGRNRHDGLPSSDRRGFRRMRVSWQATITVGGNEYPVTVTDISLGGARMETTANFPLDEILLLDIHGIAKLNAKPIHESKSVIGLQFMASPSMVSEKIPSPYVDLL